MGLVKETPSERSKRSKSDSFSVPFGPFVLEEFYSTLKWIWALRFSKSDG
jgi:hypothetical protein